MFYVAAFDVKKADAIVSCPACSTEIEIGRDDIQRNDWVCHCPKCGGVFGVVYPDRFRRYVADAWHKGEPTGPAAYCDFVVMRPMDSQGYRTFFRFHGWVDPETRAIIQVG